VYVFRPGPLEHGGAYASWLFTLFVPSVPAADAPAATLIVVEGMLYTTQYQCVSPGPGEWCITSAYPVVPVGPFVHDRDGVCDCPSHVNAIGIAPPATMSGLVRVNDVFATEPAVVVTATTAVGAVGVVPKVDVVDAPGAEVELGVTDVVATESLFDCAEHPAVTRIIQVNEVIILFFMKLRVPTLRCTGRVLWLRTSEEWPGVH